LGYDIRESLTASSSGAIPATGRSNHSPYPLFLELFAGPAARPRQREALIEFLRKGEVDEAVRAFKKLYLEVFHRIIDHLKVEEPANSSR
jgi:hypothetical protein